LRRRPAASWRKNCSGVAGGGLFIKADAEIVMNSVGEVCILFKNAGRINDYMRLARGEAETIKCIRDRLGNEVKKFWNSFCWNPVNEKTGLITIKDNKTITFKEYRIIYELLKNRDPEKIKVKYGESDFNAIIGNKVEDQFIISAIETIKKEIANIISTREAELKETKNTYQEKCNILYREQRQKEEKIVEDSSKKITELEEQIKTLMTTAPQFTF
jgi:uncharacterized DUF497 family protein